MFWNTQQIDMYMMSTDPEDAPNQAEFSYCSGKEERLCFLYTEDISSYADAVGFMVFIEDRSYASAGEVVLEKLPEDGEGKSDLADVEEAVDEDGEGDVARGGVRLLLGAEENRGGEALHLREGGEDSIERKGSAS
ncbi:hypothetical protein D0Y65_014952 [Glycine soja]|uniref:Uncharacterized protein n=1 Tax=Glycine soja TaxID=3848 RepID=A0A445KAZ9_GLYSO|nr:hypothetical protein D0Y65_014952 [Glycine soja]